MNTTENNLCAEKETPYRKSTAWRRSPNGSSTNATYIANSLLRKNGRRWYTEKQLWQIAEMLHTLHLTHTQKRQNNGSGRIPTLQHVGGCTTSLLAALLTIALTPRTTPFYQKRGADTPYATQGKTKKQPTLTALVPCAISPQKKATGVSTRKHHTHQNCSQALS